MNLRAYGKEGHNCAQVHAKDVQKKIQEVAKLLVNWMITKSISLKNGKQN